MPREVTPTARAEEYYLSHASPIHSRLYLGSIRAPLTTEFLRSHNITHVLSVVLPEEQPAFEDSIATQLTHKVCNVDDKPHEDILRHFGDTSQWISSALWSAPDRTVSVAGSEAVTTTDDASIGAQRPGGCVLVHCGLGVSRSCTIVAAYLMHAARHHPQQLQQAIQQGCVEMRGMSLPQPPHTTLNDLHTVDGALAFIAACRNIVCPNDGFMRQLYEWQQQLDQQARRERRRGGWLSLTSWFRR